MVIHPRKFVLPEWGPMHEQTPTVKLWGEKRFNLRQTRENARLNLSAYWSVG